MKTKKIQWLYCTQLNSIELNWIQLNSIQLNSTKLTCTHPIAGRHVILLKSLNLLSQASSARTPSVPVQTVSAAHNTMFLCIGEKRIKNDKKKAYFPDGIFHISLSREFTWILFSQWLSQTFQNSIALKNNVIRLSIWFS